MLGRKIYFLIVFFIALPAVLFAQNGVHTHDGFFMRFLVGPGYSQMTIDDVEGSEYKFSGAAGEFRFQIGSEISQNLIAYGVLGGGTITDPEVEWKGETHSTEDVKASAFDIGAGLTYYFMPDNYFVSGSLVGSRVQLEVSDKKFESDYGFGFFASVGKEWWVGDDWGLGVAIFGYFSSVPDKDPSDATISNVAFGAAFSATFN